jgi:hypothetical protein
MTDGEEHGHTHIPHTVPGASIMRRAGSASRPSPATRVDLRSSLDPDPLPAFVRTEPGNSTNRSQEARSRGLTRPHSFRNDLPELHRLATTIETWWPQIQAFLHTGITNAGSEGTNRVIKTIARDAYGFRNPVNQRLRTRTATTRRHRGHLNPA